MYSHNISEMADAVMKTVRRDVPVTQDQIEKALTAYWADKMAIVWSADDMHQAANRVGRALAEGEAAELLQRICSKHDASVGVSWQTLEIFASDEGRPLTADERATRDADDGEGTLIVAAE